MSHLHGGTEKSLLDSPRLSYKTSVIGFRGGLFPPHGNGFLLTMQENTLTAGTFP